MTIREAIKAEVLIPGIPEGKINKSAEDLGLDPDLVYNSGNHKDSVTKASLAVLYSLRGLTSISEGGFSISLNPAAIEQRIANLVNGSDAKPTVSDASSYW